MGYSICGDLHSFRNTHAEKALLSSYNVACAAQCRAMLNINDSEPAVLPPDDLPLLRCAAYLFFPTRGASLSNQIGYDMISELRLACSTAPDGFTYCDEVSSLHSSS